MCRSRTYTELRAISFLRQGDKKLPYGRLTSLARLGSTVHTATTALHKSRPPNPGTESRSRLSSVTPRAAKFRGARTPRQGKTQPISRRRQSSPIRYDKGSDLTRNAAGEPRLPNTPFPRIASRAPRTPETATRGAHESFARRLIAGPRKTVL